MSASPASTVKDSSDPNIDHVTALFHRRIEFHLERKPYKGFSDEGNNGFKLETLNPNTSDFSSKLDPQKSLSGAVSGTVKVLEGSNHGLDPELGFRISFRRIGAGLQNLGNTCFLNSVLQCLTYTEPLAAYLQSGRHKVSCHAAGFCALCAIQKHVSRALESTGRILVPKDLVSNLRCISRNFKNARQEDAHEYMVNLLESMHKCCIPSGVPSESPSAYEKSLVHMIFGGRLRSQVKCLQCSFSSNKFDPFLDLSLEIVKADSLAKALANFTAQEHLDGGERQYQCQQCKQKVRALKQLTVHKAPEVLTIHLKRFASHAPGVKIDKKVAFPTALDLKRYVSGPHDGNLNYTLYGVLVHAGWSTHSGHYYCFVRTSSGMWYCLDDNQVVQVNEGKVLQQKAYMLFYVRDRKNSVPKKNVDVSLKDNGVMKALGNKVCNNFNLGLEEPNQSKSIEKKSGDSVSCTVDQSLVSDINLKKSGIKIDSTSNVGGPSEKTSISNSTLSMASERVNGMHSISKAPPSKVGEGVNGIDPSGLGCSSLTKDHVTESSLKVPTVSSENGSPMSNVTAESSVVKAVPFFHNPLSLDKYVQNAHNKLNGSAKNLNDGVLQSLTSSWDANNEKDHNRAIDGHSTSVGLPTLCSSTSSITSATKSMQDGVASEVIVASDLHSSMDGGSGQGEYKQPEPNLRRKSQEKKLHGVKRRSLKHQTTRIHLSSSFVFGAALGRRKKHKRGKNQSMAKVDVEAVQSDTGPSTSKKVDIVHNICSAHSPKGKKVDASTNLIEISVMDEGSRKTVKQNCNSTATPLLQKTFVSATEQLPDLRESSGPEHLRTVHAKTDTMSMAVRLNDVPVVPRWDGLEPVGPSDFLESRLVDGVSIGYVADEWDEEYDMGKRKKVKQSKLEFDGHNPFQEIASRRSKTNKKAKRNHRR